MRLIRLGYWRSEDEEWWPDPRRFIDSRWDPEERAAIVDYLRGGMTASRMWGRSACRICGRPNGSGELTDGMYLWPEGLAHYVDAHEVRLPVAFVHHALATTAAVAGAEIDEHWWRRQGAKNKGSSPEQ